MKSYGQFCPIAVAAEVFAERWTPLVIRELLAGSTRFSQLERGLPRMPKSVLAQRLRSLEAAGIVARQDKASGRGSEYRLTLAGRELGDLVLLLGDWGKRWGDVEIDADNLDPDFLFWDIHRRIDVDRLPDDRVVGRFDLTGDCRRSYWLVLERPEPSLCLFDPGFTVDLIVAADAIALHRVWVGQMDLANAIARRAIVLDGPAALRRAFPGWLKLGFYARRGATADAVQVLAVG
jgi:DNA-binding HxlR family transcriptional regulator